MGMVLNKRQISHDTDRAALYSFTGLGILLVNSFLMPRLLNIGFYGNAFIVISILTGLSLFSRITYFIKKKDILIFNMKNKSLIHMKGLSFKKQGEVLKVYPAGTIPDLYIVPYNEKGSEEAFKLVFSNIPHVSIYSSAAYKDVFEYGQKLACRIGACL